MARTLLLLAQHCRCRSKEEQESPAARVSHKKNVRRSSAQPGGEDIDILPADEGQILWTDWVDVKLMTLKSETINGYLGTYQNFLTFVVEDHVRTSEFPPLHDDMRRIFRIIPKLGGWRKTVDLDGKVETNQTAQTASPRKM